MNQLKKKSGIFVLIAFVWMSASMLFAGKIQAATLTIDEINYETSTLTLKSSQGDVKGYFKKKGQSKWETMDGYFKDGKISMDISYISASSNYSLVFKGDKSTDEKTVVIPKAASGLKAAYNASNEEKTGSPIRFTNAGDRTIEWRKNNAVTWSKWENKSGEQLNYLIANGTTLYFRLAPENGTSVDKNGMRPSKEVSLKISAKKSAPDVGFDDSAYSVSLKSGMLYRIAVMNDGTVDDAETKTREWNQITSTREYNLKELCSEALSKECALQFKTGYKGSAQESRVRTLVIPAQKSLTEAEKAGIEISYTSTKSLTLKISGASDTQPYQYSIVKKEDYNNGKLSYGDLKWTDVKSTAPVNISKTSAPAGSYIYVRKKANKKLGEEGYTISSQEISVTGENGIAYPGELGLNTAKHYYIPAGRVNKGDFGTSLTFTINSYVSTKVSKIVFCNPSGGEVGEVGFVSTVAENSDKKADNSDKYIITTKITDTSALETAIENAYSSQNTNYYGTALYAKITLANDTSAPIMSTDEKGVILSVTPKSSISNPTSTSGTGYGNIFKNHYLTDVTRLYMCKGGNNISNSTRNADGEDKYFKFLLNIGSPEWKDIETGNSKGNVEISSITYEDCELFGSKSVEYINDSTYSDSATLSDKIFEVKYQYYQDKYGNANAKRAFVTVNLEKLEEELAKVKGSSIKMNTALPLVIKLNNGEVLDSQIRLTLKATATIEGDNIYYTDTAGSLPMPYKEREYDKNGNVIKETTVTPVEHSFKLKLFKSGYDKGGVTNVTMGEKGQSVLKSAKTAGNEITIELSNEKINSLGSQSENLWIWFQNGFIIKSGCRLTILDGMSNNNSASTVSAESKRVDAQSGYSAAYILKEGLSVECRNLKDAGETTEIPPETPVEASEAANVEVTEIDYENLTLTVAANNNSIVYFSVNKTTWNEMDAMPLDDGKLMMDISWISPSSEKKLYFKGNKATATTTVTLPKVNNSFKAKFNAKYGTLSLSNYNEATTFLWRKVTDYNWKEVDIDEDSATYKDFLKDIEALRIMGAKIYVMTGQTKGTVKNGSLDTGERPSKQIKVSISKRSNYPNVNLNIKKLTFNTSAKMEYYNEAQGKWVDCERNMKLEDISKVPFEGKKASGAAVVLQFRKAATNSAGASKIRVIAIPYQPEKPKAADAYSAYFETSGSGDTAKKKLVISFPQASETAPVEYAVVKAGDSFDASKASWKTVKKSDKLVKLSEKAAPEGSMIYIRTKGVKENEKKKIELRLPSACVEYKVTYK